MRPPGRPNHGTASRHPAPLLAHERGVRSEVTLKPLLGLFPALCRQRACPDNCRDSSGAALWSSTAWGGFIFTNLHTARKGCLSMWRHDLKLGVAQQTYIWRSIFLDSLYLRSRRLRIRILLIQVTFSGIRAFAVPFLLPRERKEDENKAKFFLQAEQHAFAEGRTSSL